jgi:hypothetical protein
MQELPQRLRLDAVRGLKHIKEAALDLTLPDNTVKTGGFDPSARLMLRAKLLHALPDTHATAWG